MKIRCFALISLMLGVGVVSALAQQRIGYIDSAFILEQIPEYAEVQQSVDRQAQEWEGEITRLEQEVEALFTEYQARELLYTNEERKAKQEEIMQREREIEDIRMRYFGPEGELFRQQDQLMKPVQERVLAAVEEVATRQGYDYVFDKSGDYLFLFAREEHNLSLAVLEELGIDTEQLQDRQ